MGYAFAAMSDSIRLLAFAGARDILGAGELEWPLVETCTADELLAQVCQRFPALSPYRASLRVALNGAYATAHERVNVGDEVALIPPVAGG